MCARNEALCIARDLRNDGNDLISRPCVHSFMMARLPSSMVTVAVTIMLAAASTLSDGAAAATAATGQLNLLYVIVDDLRPELEAYGVPAAATAGSPRLNAFKRDALLFERAYVQQAVCGPSRNSFLSGRACCTRLASARVCCNSCSTL